MELDSIAPPETGRDLPEEIRQTVQILIEVQDGLKRLRARQGLDRFILTERFIAAYRLAEIRWTVVLADLVAEWSAV